MGVKVPLDHIGESTRNKTSQRTARSACKSWVNRANAGEVIWISPGHLELFSSAAFGPTIVS